MKKALLLMLCIIITISFTACSKDSVSDVSITINENISAQDNDTSEKNDTIKPKNNNKNKSIKRLYISYSGINIDISNDESRIAELLELEKNATVPEVKLNIKFADITAVYDDNTEDIYGTIYIGEDNGYYLQFANSTIEGAACKLSDSSFANGLL